MEIMARCFPTSFAWIKLTSISTLALTEERVNAEGEDDEKELPEEEFQKVLQRMLGRPMRSQPLVVRNQEEVDNEFHIPIAHGVRGEEQNSATRTYDSNSGPTSPDESGGRGAVQPGQSRPVHALKELGDTPKAATQRRRRQRKTYQKERASRRIARLLPEFGMLPEG
ncbi:hypothetical protein NKR23_g3296 [Pleurostoma richardsiae]|uniref:Uncharacterized protein n=1 Tax=Pleurostoma richardsiae TaxID=41990 RepID=A0AA38S818_9PEZI|nr:hypothetical protein NKR23_g3296 [Pleurostoma richardsiae]